MLLFIYHFIIRSYLLLYLSNQCLSIVIRYIFDLLCHNDILLVDFNARSYWHRLFFYKSNNSVYLAVLPVTFFRTVNLVYTNVPIDNDYLELILLII